MIQIDCNNYLTKFENSIDSSINTETKVILLNILESRLNGSFEPTCLITNDNLTFNFEKNLTEEQISYLEIFNEYYFSNELVSKNVYENVAPIIEKMKKNYEEIEKYMNTCNQDNNAKEVLMYVTLYGTINYHLNEALEFMLASYKIKKLEEIIIQHFNSIFEDDRGDKFDIIKILSIKNQPIKFKDIFNSIHNFIRQIYYRRVNNKMNSNKIDLLSSGGGFNEGDKEIVNNMNTLLKLDKILNGLFWIVYADEFKFIDDIQKMILIEDSKFQEFENKMSYIFENYDKDDTDDTDYDKDDKLCETFLDDYNFINERANNILTNVLKMIQKDDFEKTSDAYVVADDEYDDILEMLNEQIIKYIDLLNRDEDVKQFYKSNFKINDTSFIEIHKKLQDIYDDFTQKN
jgi:hypothetical protein